MSWSHYYNGDLVTALKYARLRRDRDKGNPEWKKIYSNLSREFNTFYLSWYHTILNYSTSVKDDGSGDTALVTWTHNSLHRVDVAYSKLKIDYMDPAVDELNETGIALGYSSLGTDRMSFTYKRITTNEETLGDANIYFLSVDNESVSLQVAYSVYDTTTAVQAGFAHHYYNKKIFSLHSTVCLTHRSDIENIASKDDYTTLEQELVFDLSPWTLSCNYVIGDHAQYVRNQGFLPANAPEVMELEAGGKIYYRWARFTAGYEFSWGRGDHMITGNKFKITAHTLTLSFLL